MLDKIKWLTDQMMIGGHEEKITKVRRKKKHTEDC